MLRFVEAARAVDSTILPAEDGALIHALTDAGAQVEVMPLSERARGLKRTEVRSSYLAPQAVPIMRAMVSTLPSAWWRRPRQR